MEVPDETLGNKAFRFGIFCSRIESVKTLPLHCFATEICRIPIVRNPACAGAVGVKQVLPCRRSLAKVVGRRVFGKVFPYYGTKFGVQQVLAGKMAG